MKPKEMDNTRLLREHESRYVADAEWPEVSDAERERYKKRTKETRDELLNRLYVAEAHDRESDAKDEVVKQLNNIRLLWDGGYIKATDDGLLRAETVEKAWEALATLEAVQNE